MVDVGAMVGTGSKALTLMTKMSPMMFFRLVKVSLIFWVTR